MFDEGVRVHIEGLFVFTFIVLENVQFSRQIILWYEIRHFGWRHFCFRVGAIVWGEKWGVESIVDEGYKGVLPQKVFRRFQYTLICIMIYHMSLVPRLVTKISIREILLKQKFKKYMSLNRSPRRWYFYLYLLIAQSWPQFSQQKRIKIVRDFH